MTDLNTATMLTRSGTGYFDFVHMFWTECRRGTENELNEALGVHWQLRFGMAMKCGQKILLSQENEVTRSLRNSYPRWKICSEPLKRHKGAV